MARRIVLTEDEVDQLLTAISEEGRKAHEGFENLTGGEPIADIEQKDSKSSKSSKKSSKNSKKSKK